MVSIDRYQHLWYYMNMDMQRTLRIRIHPDAETATLFAETVRLYTSSFNEVARVGWETNVANGVELHKATYYTERERTGLPAQLTCAARVKATEALKSAKALTAKERKKPEDKQRLPTMPQSDFCPIRYDARSYKVNLVAGTGSLLTVSGRRVIALALTPYHRRYTAWKTASADLLCDRQGRWWLHVVVSSPVADVATTDEVVGVDLGIAHPATDSRGIYYGSDHWVVIEDKTFQLKRRLQAKGTRSAKRHLQKMSGRQRRFRRDCDHVLSKRLVASVTPGATLVFEDLTDIRGRAKARKEQKRRLHGWSFAQLRDFAVYKAEERGVTVGFVDPRYTSQKCSACGHRDRANRVDQSHFVCVSCGFACNADHNASMNIRDDYQRAAVSLPIVGGESLGLLATHKPPALAGGG